MFALITSIFVLLGVAEQPRVISLAPSITQIVREFGVEPIGVSDFCEAPKEVLRLGGLGNPNLEAIIRLKPDFVFLLGRHSGLSKKLYNFKIPVYSFLNDSVEEIRYSMSQLGVLLGKESRARELVKRTELKSLKAEKKIRVAVLIAGDYDSLSGLVAAGSKSIYGELLKNLGAVNIFKGHLAYPSTSIDNILSSRPKKVILFLNPKQKADHALIKKKLLGTEVVLITDSSLLIPGLNVEEIYKALYEAIR